MGNSNSTEYNHKNDSDRASTGSGNTNAATAPSPTTSATSGYQFEKKSAAPPVVTTAASSSSSSSHKQRHAVPFRLSVTTVPDNNSDHNSSPLPSATTFDSDSNMELTPSSPNDLSASPTTTTHSTTVAATSNTPTATTTTTTATKAVPLSTGKSGWVSSTGNASPWYGGSLSSSASSHHRSDSVRGPYYRTRGMSINREQEIEEEQFPQQQQQQQRLSRNRSIIHQSKGVPTIINWSQGGQNVYVTGTFNGWKHKIKLVKSTQDFATVLELPPGTHRLKFIVDDEWKCSNEMETATDPDGNLVNYLQVIDENEDPVDELGDSSTSTDRDIQSRSSTPTSEYTSEIPPDLLALAKSLSTEENGGQGDDKSSTSNTIAMEWDQQQPPSLPPHLEKVLLNSQNLSDEDNSVLPEPNHVTLNHLYASSIKDNVMALSTTTRYRKKYVTTMYYRPVYPKQ